MKKKSFVFYIIQGIVVAVENTGCSVKNFKSAHSQYKEMFV